MKRLLIIIVSLPFIVNAQKPVINSFSPTHIEVNQTVTISGTNLNGAEVFFGGVKATATSTTENTIKVPVPAGVRNDVITVLNNGLMTQSSQQFFISFSGNDISNFSSEYLETTDELNGFDVCLCDLNNDDLNDAIISHSIVNNVDNDIDNEVTIFQNQSTPTATSFSKTNNINNPDNNGGYLGVDCGDLDNDGKPDVVFTTNNGQNVKQIFIYRNVSAAGVSLSYQNGLSLALPKSGSSNRTPRKIKIADIDGDGKADLVVGNSLDSKIFVFRNTSSSAISFDSPIALDVSDAPSTGSIEVADLNNDGLPDIALLGFQASNSGIFILKNKSRTNEILFENEEGISQTSQRDNITLGDFDNDGLIDLATSSGARGRVRVYKNNSAGSDIIFEQTSTIINISGTPWGIDLGDLNGDGLLDIAVPSIGGGIFLIENTSSSSISFSAPVKLNTSNFARHLRVADLNGDAKPDIAFTHSIRTTETTNLAVFTNQNCVIPTISPDNLEFCIGDPFTLEATKSLGTTYAWSIESGDGNAIPDTDADADVQINSGSTATIRVTVTDTNGCSQFDEATFSLVNGAQPAPPAISGAPTDVVCVGDDFTLVAPASQASYEWIHPNGDITTTQQLAITGASFEDAGTYSLRVRSAGSNQCLSLEATVNVEVSDAPSLSIVNPELDNFCEGESVQLKVPDVGNGFSYLWQLNGTTDLGTSTSITATQAGDYTLTVTDDATNCSNTSEVKTLNTLTVPNSVIDSNTEVCDGFPTTFTSSSTGQNGFTLQYYWEIENDANTVIHTSTQSSITDYTFPAGEANYEVNLTTAYDSTVVNGCGNTTTMAVAVVAPPAVQFSEVDGVEKCQGDAVNIGITSPNTADIVSYNWVVRDTSSAATILTEVTTPTVDVSTPSGVNAAYAISTITTTTGCTVIDTVEIRNFIDNVSISTPDQLEIVNDTITLENEFFVNLQSENLVSGFQWTPEELIDDPTAQMVRVFPDQQIVPVTVTGLDANNCTVTSQIIIAIDIVRPKKTFSPNDDGKNDCWEVYNVSSFGCEAFIFDSRGRNILVTSTFDENCVWDGNFNGSPVPEGVYYYVIKCTSGGINKSGSILLAR